LPNGALPHWAKQKALGARTPSGSESSIPHLKREMWGTRHQARANILERRCEPLKPLKWSPKEFAHILRLPESPAKRRAYQATQQMLDKSGMKALREWETFTSFCQVAGFVIEPAGVVMLDPNSSSPPPPDLRCNIDGLPHFFELGEIIQQDIARALSRLESRPIAEPRMPLDMGLEPLEIILNKKLDTCYVAEARPISLLLY